MKPNPNKRDKRSNGALKALRRAAKRAVDLARATGTPAYVIENGRIIDAAKRARKLKGDR